MKNRFLFFLSGILFFLANPLLAQTNVYHPFPDSGAIWFNFYSSFDAKIYYYTIYTVGGDTIINNLTYRKILRGNYVPGGEYTPPTFNNSFIRDDTADKKVYIRVGGVDTDQLLYDFNIKTGDTLSYSYTSDTANGGARVVSMDSVQLNDGTYRKRWGLQTYLSDTIDTTFLIEGIGSTEGIFNEISGVYSLEGDDNWLSCFTEQDTTLFDYDTTGTGLTCFLPTGIYNPNTVTAQLFPNPVTLGGSITAKGITEQYTFTLDNILGQQVFSKEIIYPDQPISLPALLANGVYLCRIKTQSNLVFVKKIVIL